MDMWQFISKNYRLILEYGVGGMSAAQCTVATPVPPEVDLGQANRWIHALDDALGKKLGVSVSVTLVATGGSERT